jgi:sugar lactone lactonase YvrE
MVMNGTICGKVLVLFGFGIWLSSNIAVAENLFVAEYDSTKLGSGSNSIYEYTPSGDRSTFATGFGYPRGLVFDGSGNLFAGDRKDGGIYKFSLDGSRSLFGSLQGVSDLALDGSGNLFASSSSAFFSSPIYRFTPSGTPSPFTNVSFQPEGLAFSPSGNLFAADWSVNANTIFQFSPSGSRSIFATGLNHPVGLAFDSSGSLFEADFGTGTIYKFTPSGETTTFATGLDKPAGLAFDSSGNLFEADWGSGSIYKFTPSGQKSTFATGLVNPVALAFSPIPEPSTLILSGIGAISLLAYVWRRRAS